MARTVSRDGGIGLIVGWSESLVTNYRSIAHPHARLHAAMLAAYASIQAAQTELGRRHFQLQVLGTEEEEDGSGSMNADERDERKAVLLVAVRDDCTGSNGLAHLRE